jgi:hypothetical protein
MESDGYWHAYEAHRSVSLTSLMVSDGGRPMTAAEMVRQLPRMEGTPVEELPRGLLGRAVVADAIRPARASRRLSGMLAVEGRMLIVTMTSDDLDWARRTWLSIRGHPRQPPVRQPSRASRRASIH